jgi:drug/metabolite transporter (DMT)-like permease
MDYFLLLLTVLFWSGNFVMGRWIYPEVPPVTLAFLRWTLALVILLPFPFREVYRQRDVIRQNLKMLALLALLSVTNFNIFLYVSLNTSPVANAALINSTTPIFIVILLHLLFGRRISLLQGIGIVLSLSGLTFIVLRGDLAVLGTLRFAQGDCGRLPLPSAGLCIAYY